MDSQAAIRALGNTEIRSKTVIDTTTSLNKLAASCTTVTIVWIPAHRGHAGNERADTLAKYGARTVGPATFAYKPLRTIKNEISKIAYDRWTTAWQSLDMAQHSRSFYSGPDHNKARYVYKLARLELGRFVRLVTGHNNLNFFQTKIGLWHDPFCRFCGQGQETLTHMLFSCPCLSREASQIFPRDLPSADMSWSVRELLQFSYVPAINLAMEGSWAHADPPDVCDLNSTPSLGAASNPNSDSD